MEKKNNTKKLIMIISAIVLIPFAIFLILFVAMSMQNYNMQERLTEEGPWSETAVWVSEDKTASLECTKNDGDEIGKVTGRFKINGEDMTFNVVCQGKAVFLMDESEKIYYNGDIDFDGTVFTVKKLKAWDGRPDPSVNTYTFRKAA